MMNRIETEQVELVVMVELVLLDKRSNCPNRLEQILRRDPVSADVHP